nr:MltA domain-containing protein [uncultured Holophaga sp.]
MAPFLIPLLLASAPMGAGPLLPPSETVPVDPSLRDVMEREHLEAALDESLRYLDGPKGERDYALASPPFTRERVRRSLIRLRDILRRSQDPGTVQHQLAAEFQWFPLAGGDGQGTVTVTGYFTPVYEASRERKGDWVWPLYRRPSDLERWPLPQPTRAQLEGKDGRQGPRGKLKGLELFWLRNRWDAYMIQVQGSANLKLPDGRLAAVGYHGATSYPYTPVTLELSRDHRIQESCRREGKVSLREHFAAHPEDMDTYLQRNNRFVFFQELPGPPRGSLGVPVTPMRTVALDSRLFPPGIPLLIAGAPSLGEARLLVAQDTGVAIQGPGRLDVYCGIGPEAGAEAGKLTHLPVRAYVMLLKDSGGQ